MTNIAVFTFYPTLKAAAKTLAAKLGLPVKSNADYLLLLTPDYLGLQKTLGKSLPLYINFLSKRFQYRRENMSLRKEALVRALGLKSHSEARIVDATAGLARDSFILAAFGFHVQMIERSPIIHALVKDGLERASKNPDLLPIIKRMELIQSDAAIWLKESKEKPDIIYLDPMFPERKKSALSKLDMQIFHDIVGDDLDQDELFKTALACARKRVVVKRPRLARELSGIKPHHSLSGSSSRFDIYIT
ncbi:MAG TPA: class I SAM-dependent methyltransferase [Gammaproteobacteria bacterium]|nr:class I SAM-dependent methyltransferase [Gammaproteobacteria bacterium]